jgi:hypothetical protein
MQRARFVLGSVFGSCFLLVGAQACVVNTTDSGGGTAGYGASTSVGGSTGVGAGGSTTAGAGGTTGGSAGATAGAGGSTGGSAGATAGSGGTTGGSAGSATAGSGGTTGGSAGSATAGSGGSKAGSGGTSTAGSGGSATAGSGGTAAAGAGGTAAAGAGGSGTGGTGGAPGTCLVRLAHLACDAGGAADVCFKPSGVSSWTDPKVTQLFKAAMDPDAFYYPAVTIYFEVDEGTYDVRMIDAGSTCDKPYDPAFDHTTITFNPGSHYTLPLEGELAMHNLKFQLIADDPNPTDGKVGFQSLNALTQTQGDLNFCLQEPVNQSISTVTTGVVGLGPAKSNLPTYPQTPPTLSSGDPPKADWRALMFLDNQDSKTYAISNYRQLHANEQYFSFVAGTKLDDPDPLLRPQVIACLNDLNDPGTSGNPTIAVGCGYYPQTSAPPPLRHRNSKRRPRRDAFAGVSLFHMLTTAAGSSSTPPRTPPTPATRLPRPRRSPPPPTRAAGRTRPTPSRPSASTRTAAPDARGSAGGSRPSRRGRCVARR